MPMCFTLQPGQKSFSLIEHHVEKILWRTGIGFILKVYT